MLVYALTITLSAFLLFLVQPIIAKQILPWFGGSSAVWTTCVFFFQFLLLAGYAYAHAVVRFLSPRAQILVHVALLAGSLAVLPIVAGVDWKPTGEENPSIRILGLLLATVGLPYFLLSSTSPLVQAWYSRRFDSPYRLFALSNLASLAALLAYPVAIEQWIATRAQALLWSWGYAAFAIACGVAAMAGLRGASGAAGGAPGAMSEPAPGVSERLQWVLLPAIASYLLLAITYHLTQNVASIPFLWVLPLTLYLLTFILCFDGRGWYRRGVFFPASVVALAAMAWILRDFELSHMLKLVIPVYAAGLFVLCMFCHGELVRIKPAPSRLTEFYMLISLGGALGSLAVSVMAPSFLPGDFELSGGLVLAAFALALRFRGAGRIALAAGLATIAFVGWASFDYVSSFLSEARVIKRNFYSSLRTYDEDRESGQVRKLIHGSINHGSQFTDPQKRRMPIGYFGPTSGIARGLEALRERAAADRRGMRVGVVGLGAGVLAAWGRAGDYYHFYEINPQVIELAQTEFSYLKDSAAEIELTVGDGRLALEAEKPRQFDLLAADAFSSDSVPMHLLTREAMQLYLSHIRPGGVIVFNVTNRYLDLAPVVKRLADSLGLHARLVSDWPEGKAYDIYAGTDFVLVSADPSIFAAKVLAGVVTEIEVKRRVSVWTDDFNNLLEALK